jgi:cell shape-determining protein MreC
MTKETKDSIIPEEVVMSKIYYFRDKKVMIDRDLAELYGVETRVLNQAVRRNEKRFPEDFMFQMTQEEVEEWKSQIVISNAEKMGLRKAPIVFTEQGVAMLSSVLNSDRAISVNIQIIRIFTKMRSFVLSNKDIMRKLENMERQFDDHDKKIEAIFDYLKKLKSVEQEESEFKNRNRIGYKP